MGLYINPQEVSKEQWLNDNGEQLEKAPVKMRENKEEILVCLIDNGPFTAAGVAFNQAELNNFCKEDMRYKEWFVVGLDKIKRVCSDEWENYFSNM